MKKILNVALSRLVVTASLILLQAFLLLFLIYEISAYSVIIYFGLTVIGAMIVLTILSNNTSNPAFKIPWIILLLLFPLLGIFLYLLNGNSKEKKKIREAKTLKENYLEENTSIINKIYDDNKNVYGQVKYIFDTTGYPVYDNVETTYFELGEFMYQDMLKELQKASKFIFLEYFIIDEGKMWDSIREILLDKINNGVDVRVIYDDIGSISTLPNNYKKTLEELGIKCVVFNPFVPVLSIIHNNRDHRKYMIIDGNICYTGGINLADEYINEIEKYGHWKDTGIKLVGEGVKSFTVSFLDTWNFYKKEDQNYISFLPSINVKNDGYVIPFEDSPLNNDTVGLGVYMNIIDSATNYVYITTPYLILTSELIDALCRASKRSVDVKIITPNIPDKWAVNALTQSFYLTLMASGVEIYEYTPGFIHSKVFLSDDIVGVVGTINLDYRSLYHHYEDAVYLYKTSCLKNIKDDFKDVISASILMNEKKYLKTPWYKRLVGSILNIFGPLM